MNRLSKLCLVLAVCMVPAALGGCTISGDTTIGERVDASTARDATQRWMPGDRCGNGVDDDDDGRIDEGCPCGAGETQSCFSGSMAERGVGTCSDGSQTCTVVGVEWGDWGDAPCQGDVRPVAELCDGRDHDCNGAPDDGCPCIAGASSPCGVEFIEGECRAGTQTCRTDGTWSGCDGAIGPRSEICDNGLDENCDGDTDELCGCEPEPEVCRDGIDNDCDGVVDEPACTPDWMPDGGPLDATAPMPDGGVTSSEVCGNGIDDDFDGASDEGCALDGGAPTEVCCNGIDDDLDGVVDDGCRSTSACSTYSPEAERLLPRTDQLTMVGALGDELFYPYFEATTPSPLHVARVRLDGTVTLDATVAAATTTGRDPVHPSAVAVLPGTGVAVAYAGGADGVTLKNIVVVDDVGAVVHGPVSVDAGWSMLEMVPHRGGLVVLESSYSLEALRLSVRDAALSTVRTIPVASGRMFGWATRGRLTVSPAGLVGVVYTVQPSTDAHHAAIVDLDAGAIVADVSPGGLAWISGPEIVWGGGQFLLCASRSSYGLSAPIECRTMEEDGALSSAWTVVLDALEQQQFGIHGPALAWDGCQYLVASVGYDRAGVRSLRRIATVGVDGRARDVISVPSRHSQDQIWPLSDGRFSVGFTYAATSTGTSTVTVLSPDRACGP